MTQTLISTKYQVVIPKEVREMLHLKSGQKMNILVKGRVIHLIPEVPLSSLRGMLKKKVSLHDLREKKDRMI